MSLKGLRCLVVIAEELHFGHAAERLGIAQPAVTQQLQRLETALGLQLVHRGNGRVRLTDAGHAFLPHARNALEATDFALKAGRAAARGDHGEVAIGLTATVPPARMVDLLRQSRVRKPRVRLRIREVSLEAALDQLQQGGLQLAITTGFARPPAPPEVRFVRLAAEPLMCALHESHRLVGEGPLTLSDLAGERFSVITQDALAGRPFGVQGMCERDGFEPLLFAEVRDCMMQLAMVATGHSVAILPESAARYAPPELRFVPIDYDRPLLTVLAYHADYVPATALAALGVDEAATVI